MGWAVVGWGCVVYFDVVWCSGVVMWCGTCGVVWCDMVWCGIVLCCVV